jgi:hypothetical protein
VLSFVLSQSGMHVNDNGWLPPSVWKLSEFLLAKEGTNMASCFTQQIDIV